MRGLLPAAVVFVFQLVYLGLLRGMFLGEGVQAVAVESLARPPTSWSSLTSRAARHELVSRQTSSGNRTKDLYDFFAPTEPPPPCGLKCELIWGAVSGCDLLSCVCTERWGHEFENCVRCLAPNPTPTQTDYYQGILTEFASDYCAGYHVPALSFAGGDSQPPTSTFSPNVTIPSITASATAIIMNDVPRNIPQVILAMVLACAVSMGLWQM